MKNRDDSSSPVPVAVQVMCRVRPFQSREFLLSAGEQIRSIITMTDTTTSFLDPKDDYHEKEGFHFDWNIWSIPADQQEIDYPVSTQQDVFQRVGKRALGHLFDGFNSCLLAYGQTGSGKTYTILGSEAEKGLIPLFCDELFSQIRAFSQGNHTYHVEATLLEIYNERVKDLLWELGDKHSQQAEKWDGENLRVRNAPGQGPYVVGLTTVVVESAADCEVLISIGMQNRVVAVTKMNDQSSRSHALFRLTLVQEVSKPGSGPVTERSASSVFADLAGSERLKKSGAQGLRMKEAAAINQSLTTLRSVIDALVDHRPVVPFRESTLTLLLSECLGGNSITTMIACVSPHADNAEETLNTLRYAHRAQGIVCRPKVGETEISKRIGRLKEELLETQRMIEEGSDSQKLMIVRAENERRMDQLEHSSRLTRKEMSNIMKDLYLEKQRRYVSSYSRAFHVVMLQRSLAAVLKRDDILNQQIALATRALTEPQKQLDCVIQQRSEAKKAQEAQYKALTAATWELERVSCACDELEARNKELAAEDERLKNCRSQHLAKLKYDHVRLALLIGDRRHSTHAELEKIIEQLNLDVRKCAEIREEKSTARERQRLVSLRDVEMRIKQKTTLIEESLLEQAAIHQAADQKLHKLSEAAVFFEHENRAVDDERILRLQHLERDAEKRFRAEHDILQEKCTGFSQKMERQHLNALGSVRAERSAFERQSSSLLDDIVRDGKQRVSACISHRKASQAQSVLLWRKQLESHCTWEMESADCVVAWQQLQQKVDADVSLLSGVSLREQDAVNLQSAIRRADGSQLLRRSNRLPTQVTDRERAQSARSASEKLLFQPQVEKPAVPTRSDSVKCTSAARVTDPKGGSLRAPSTPKPKVAVKAPSQFAIGSRRQTTSH